VAAAVEWNVLLQRRKHLDASEAIDHTANMFNWYLSYLNFKVAFIKWNLEMDGYEEYKAKMHRHLVTDKELIENATPEVRRKWKELDAEIE
jgi:hypothetical protein